MPFADASFDGVWTQHASTNIADKDRFYAEMHRVLGPGGRLALYDILAGLGACATPLIWGLSDDLAWWTSSAPGAV